MQKEDAFLNWLIFVLLIVNLCVLIFWRPFSMLEKPKTMEREAMIAGRLNQ